MRGWSRLRRTARSAPPELARDGKVETVIVGDRGHLGRFTFGLFKRIFELFDTNVVVEPLVPTRLTEAEEILADMQCVVRHRNVINCERKRKREAALATRATAAARAEATAVAARATSTASSSNAVQEPAEAAQVWDGVF